jgi:hypothetical protein
VSSNRSLWNRWWFQVPPSQVNTLLIWCDVINLLPINTGYAFLCNVDYTASHPKTTVFVLILPRSCYKDNCLYNHPHTFFYIVFHTLCHWSTSTGRNSSVGIASRYGLEGPGIDSRWEARFSAHVQTGCGPLSLLYNGHQVSFPGVKWSGRGVDQPPPASAEVKEIVELMRVYIGIVTGSSYLY